MGARGGPGRDGPAFLRPPNAAAQLVLRTQARRKEQGPPFPTPPPSPLRIHPPTDTSPYGYIPLQGRRPCGYRYTQFLVPTLPPLPPARSPSLTTPLPLTPT